MSGAASRTRGANAERAVVNYLKQQGWDQARRVLAGDGHQHSDIECWQGISIEIKDRSSSAWPSWREQAITQARPEDVVVVMRRTRGITNVGIVYLRALCTA
jgi:Holliday junction resolvase